MEESISILSIAELLRWLEHCQVQEAVKKKYDELFEKYECFHKANGAYIPMKASSTPHPHHHHRAEDRKHHRPEKPPKDFRKMLTSYLNKLNHTNYDRILAKTRIIIHQDNIQEAVESIMNNCCVQPLYLKHLARMVYDLYKLSGCSKQIREGMEAYYTRYMQEERFMYRGKEEDEYTQFCQMQKHKMMVLNLTSVWFHIWATYPELLPNHTQTYVALFTQRVWQHVGDEYHLDLFLNVVVECCAHAKDMVSSQSKDWAQLKSQIQSSKVRFVIEKIQGALEAA